MLKNHIPSVSGQMSVVVIDVAEVTVDGAR